MSILDSASKFVCKVSWELSILSILLKLPSAKTLKTGISKEELPEFYNK